MAPTCQRVDWFIDTLKRLRKRKVNLFNASSSAYEDMAVLLPRLADGYTTKLLASNKILTTPLAGIKTIWLAKVWSTEGREFLAK